MKKKVLEPTRLRRVPTRFSWVDHRLVRQRRLSGCAPPAWALYLLLITVSDAEGLSYYGEGSLCAHLGLSTAELIRARRQLCAAGVIAWEAPIYQVLDLQGDPPPEAAAPAVVIDEPPPPPHGHNREMARLFERLLGEGGAQ